MISHVTLAAPVWERAASLPEANCGFIAGAIGENIVIAGGTNWANGNKRWLDHIWLFEASRQRWRNAGRLPSPLAYAASGATADGIWFAGGSSGSESPAALGLLDRQAAVRIISTGVPLSVYSASATLDGFLYVIGGAPAQDQLPAITKSCCAIELRTAKVSKIAGLPAPGVAIAAAAACAGRIFVFGGAHWNAAAGEVANTARVLAWSPGEERWSPLTPYPFAVRGLSAVALDSRHLYVAGGYKNDEEEFTDQSFIFDAQTGIFHPAAPLPLRALVSLVVAGEYVYCLGGEDQKKRRTDSAFRIRWKELLPPGGRPAVVP
jgi:N-acetylneuraminic acid mutarotase